MSTSSHSRESLGFHTLHIPLGSTWAIFCSVTQLCLSLCDPMDCSMLGFPDLHHLPEPAHTHACWDMSCTVLKFSGQLIIFTIVCLTSLYVCVMQIRTLFISQEFIIFLKFLFTKYCFFLSLLSSWSSN